MNDNAFADRYASAVQTSDLRQHEHRVSSPDVLAAFAVVDRNLSTHAYRARVANDPAAIKQLAAMHRADVRKMAQHRKWHVKLPVMLAEGKVEIGDVLLPLAFVWAVADASMRAWIWDVCPNCTGRKFETMQSQSDGRQVLSDSACKACNGTGKSAPDVVPIVLLPYVEECLTMLRARFESIGRRANRKLR